MEQWLSARFDMYCLRDGAYVSRLLKELDSENGIMEFLYDGDNLAGLKASWGDGRKVQRLLYTDETNVGVTGRKPMIMARLTCTEAFLSLFSLREPGEE